jgi:hypothetical protein
MIRALRVAAAAPVVSASSAVAQGPSTSLDTGLLTGRGKLPRSKAVRRP